MSRPALTPDQIRARIFVTDVVWNGTQCWRWNGQHRKRDGRPIFNGRYVYRVVYELERGPLPQGKGHASHHGCEHQWCINPWHVASISQSEHMHMHELGGDWGQAQKTHCPAGHPYDEANTYRWRGERRCRICANATSLRSYYANVEKNRAKARERMKRRKGQQDEAHT
jgi:hypothetical protein